MNLPSLLKFESRIARGGLLLVNSTLIDAESEREDLDKLYIPANDLAIKGGNAKAANMPNDTIKKAILKGTGELGAVSYEQVVYEGYGPGGVAIFLECVTDNTNRTVAEIRHIMSKGGGNLGQSGSVAWMFERKGQIYLDGKRYDEEVANQVIAFLRRGKFDVAGMVSASGG